MSDQGHHDPATIVADLLPEVSEATVSAGGSILQIKPDVRADRFTSAWKLLRPFDDAPPPLPPPPPLPEQIGPFNFDPIVFGGGVPVGGRAQLTLFRDGAVNFNGHFHVSGTPSYNVACTFAVMDGATPPQVFTFTKGGRVHGTFEPGSRDFDWGETPPPSPAISNDWPNLAPSWRWHAQAGADIDIGALVDTAVKGLGYVGTVAGIIAIIV